MRTSTARGFLCVGSVVEFDSFDGGPTGGTRDEMETDRPSRPHHVRSPGLLPRGRTNREPNPSDELAVAAAEGRGQVVAAVLAFDPDLPRDPPDRRMEEEQGLHGHLDD